MKNNRLVVISQSQIIFFCITYISVSSVFPPIAGYLGNINTFICMGLNIVLLLLALKNNNICFANNFHTLITIFVLLITVLVPYIAGNSVWANRYIDLLFFITAPCCFRFFFYRKEMKYLKKTVIFVCISASITWTVTIINLMGNPYLARSIKSSGETTASLKQSGIGGYEYVYFCVIVGVMFFCLFWYKKQIRYLIISVIALLMCIMSNYMTALLLFVVGIILCIISGRTRQQRIIGITIILLLLIGFNYCSSWLIEMVSNLTPDGRIARLLSNNNEGIIKGIINEFTVDRLPTLLSSINIITMYHGMGVYFVAFSTILSSLGQHSYILDTLAIMGIPLGGAYLFIVYKGIFRNVVPVVVITIILLTLNNATASIAVALFLFVPTLRYYLLPNQNRNSAIKS